MKAYFFVNNENASYFYIYIRVKTFALNIALSPFYSFFSFSSIYFLSFTLKIINHTHYA